MQSYFYTNENWSLGRGGTGGAAVTELSGRENVFFMSTWFFFGFLRRRWIRRAGWMWNTSTTTWKSTSKSRSPTPTTKCRWGRAPPSPTRAASASGPSPQTSPSAHFPIVNSISFPPFYFLCNPFFDFFWFFFFFMGNRSLQRAGNVSRKFRSDIGRRETQRHSALVANGSVVRKRRATRLRSRHALVPQHLNVIINSKLIYSY